MTDPRPAPPTPRRRPETGPILVVDFGAQYAQLIARRVREAHVYSEIVPHTITAAEVAARNPAGIIFCGGPKSVHVEGAPVIDPGVYDLGVPVLGICYGAQLVAQQLGRPRRQHRPGRVRPHRAHRHRARRRAVRRRPAHHPAGVDEPLRLHLPAPDGFTVTASTPDAPVAAMEDVGAAIHAVQFHPEVVHTPHGQAVLENWLYDVCGCPPAWTMSSVIDSQVDPVRRPRSATPG